MRTIGLAHKMTASEIRACVCPNAFLRPQLLQHQAPLDPGMKVLVVGLDIIRALECFRAVAWVDWHPVMMVPGSILCELFGLVYLIVVVSSTGIQAVLDFIDKCEDPSLGKEFISDHNGYTWKIN